MTNENKTAQELASEWFTQMVTDWYDGQIDIGDDHQHISIIQQALQPKPSVDVEGLKKIDDAIRSLQEDWQTLKPEHIQEWLDQIEKGVNQIKSQGHLNQGWQPIESAPRDGTMMLVYKDKKVSIVKWIDGDSICKGAFFKTNSVFYHEEYLTHWMPLPQPPKSEDE